MCSYTELEGKQTTVTNLIHNILNIVNLSSYMEIGIDENFNCVYY